MPARLSETFGRTCGDSALGAPNKLDDVPRLRIALAQVNTSVGDLAGNAELIASWTARAAARGARVVVFPEMALTGYPVEDLALRASFVEASITALRDLAQRLSVQGLGGIAVVTGYLDRRTDLAPRTGQPAGAPLDAAAVLFGGRVVITSAKHHLPNYGVFDEYRYFIPGSTLPVFRVPAGDGDSVDVAVAICEDLWQDGGPVGATRHAHAGLLVVPNASPYERGKDDVRLDLVRRRACEAGAALAYCNQVGGQDELVFDGDSILVDAHGEPLARGPQFEEALIVADLELPAASSEFTGAVDAGDGTLITVERVTLPEVALPVTAPGAGGEHDGPFWPRLDDLAEVYAALVTGTRDYVRKNGFKSVILGLSGGIDSALTATIAADAIGPDNVYVLLLPSNWSTSHSLSDAEELVRRQGLHARTIPIKAMVDAFMSELGEGFPTSGLPAENLQARVRGVTWMALSNAEGHLVLTAGNKSEIATGYSTLYGDSAGGFGVIKDVPKTLVWALARWRNSQAERAGLTPPIPQNSIDKAPSAELAPGQLDTDSLPSYEVLDAIIDDYVEKDMGSAELIAAGHDPALVERVIRLIDTAEYKRRQYPPGPKISQKNFGRDRRLPITNRWREHPLR
ncbi:MAG: synthetase [Actinomycetia bacterium]|nr:synthetase [Actinomycetes bacterium]